MDLLALNQVLFSMDEMEEEAFMNPRVPRVFAQSTPPFPDQISEDYFLKPDQKIAFTKHPRFMMAPEHKHDFIEINYVYAGQCTQTINGKQVNLQAGELCLLDTNVVHKIEPVGEGDIIINWLMRKSYFNSDLLSRLSGNDLLSEFIINAVYKTKEYNQFIVFHSGDNIKIRQSMNEILYEYFDRNLCSDEVISSHIIIIFSELLRLYKTRNHENLEGTSIHKAVITDILLYLEQNYTTVTLQSVAEHFNFHPNYLSRLLKIHLGMSFIKIVQAIKMKHACAILENTHIPIAKVARDVGFSNINSFYSLFHTSYGVTPKEYREAKKEHDLLRK